MQQVQFIQCTPQKLKEEIGAEFKTHLDSILQNIKPKYCEEYLTRKEVAELFKVNLSTIHSWSKNGILKPYGIGSRVYYLRSDIEAKVKPLK